MKSALGFSTQTRCLILFKKSPEIQVKMMLLRYSFVAMLLAARSVAYTNIDTDLSSIRKKFDGVGLMGFSVNQDNEFCSLGADGYRIAGTTSRVDPLARWHIGSCTKSITATLMAILIEEEAFGAGVTWSSLLPTFLPEATGTPYEEVTLKQLLGMQSSIPRNIPLLWLGFELIAGKPLEKQRRDAALLAMDSTPDGTPGLKDVYSNWAYIVAGHIQERATKMLWEDLVIEKVFLPLGISLDSTTSFGAPSGLTDAGGHIGVAPIPCTVCDGPAIYASAGGFSARTVAMATYLSWHVSCHNGQHGNLLLSQQSCQTLHTPVDRSISSYALGWRCLGTGDDLECLHGGTNGFSYYRMVIAPGKERAMAGATNSYRNFYSDSISLDTDMVEETIAYLMLDQDCSENTIIPDMPTHIWCFPGTSTVNIKNKGITKMYDLAIGDHILVEGGVYEPVYSFGHRSVDTEDIEYLQISMENGSTLELSADHMVFVTGNAIPALAVRVGDDLAGAKVRAITRVYRRGAFAPFTPSGKLMVDGILVSSYISFQTGPYLVMGSVTTPITHQWLAHAFIFPHRLHCYYLEFCPREMYTDDGISLRLTHPLRFAQWLFGQDALVIVICMIPLVALLVVFSCIEVVLHWFPLLGVGVATIGMLKCFTKRKS